MRGIDRWAHMASSSVLIAAQSGRDGYGKPTFGADVPYTGHLVHKRELVRNAQGQEVESRHQLYVLSPVVLSPTVRLTLSTGEVGSTDETMTKPVSLSVMTRFDGHGAHHTVVYFVLPLFVVIGGLL